MTKLNHSTQPCKQEPATNATINQEDLYPLAADYTKHERAVLLDICQRLFSSHPPEEIRNILWQLFTAIYLEKDLDKEERASCFLFYSHTCELSSNIEKWTLTGKRLDHLVDIVLEYHCGDHLENAVHWLDQMFQSYYYVEADNHVSREERIKIISTVNHLKSFVTSVKTWWGEHHQTKCPSKC